MVERVGACSAQLQHRRETLLSRWGTKWPKLMGGIRDKTAKVELNKEASVEALVRGELPPDADVAARASEDHREVRGRGAARQLPPVVGRCRLNR